jgi:hypothetical protein
MLKIINKKNYNFHLGNFINYKTFYTEQLKATLTTHVLPRLLAHELAMA